MLCCVVVAAGVVPDSDADVASLREMLAAALEANARWERAAAELRADNGRLREDLAGRDAELERLRADLAVLQRMVFGRSSERGGRSRRRAAAGTRGSRAARPRKGRPRGPGARAGRRDYSHLPRVEVVWDFPGGGYCCPECGTPFTGLGSDHVTELLDWLVTAGGRALPAPVPAGLRLPGSRRR